MNGGGVDCERMSSSQLSVPGKGPKVVGGESAGPVKGEAGALPMLADTREGGSGERRHGRSSSEGELKGNGWADGT